MEVKLVVVGGKRAGMEIPIPGHKFLIGRGTDCHMRLQSNQVSRKHCAILVEDGLAAVEDFGSTNGTLVNGEKLLERRELKNGDRIKVGVLELEVQLAVSVGGQKKPKVHSIQEAAARTAASATKGEDDLDISNWLEDDNAEADANAPAEPPPTTHDTTAGTKLIDTVNIPGGHEHKEKEKKPVGKISGHFERPPKPMAENSRSAAEDMLKQMFSKKKS